MNCSYWVKVVFLFVLPLAVVTQNQTIEKWERAFEALRRRNHHDAQKRLESSPIQPKEEYNRYRDNYDYFEPKTSSKEKGESHEDSQEVRSIDPGEPRYQRKETSQEERENDVSHIHKNSHREPDYSDEDYERDRRKGQTTYPEKEEYHPFSYSHSGEIDSKHPPERHLHRKTSRYSPPHLHSKVPLIPPEFRANSPYYHPPFPPRIYLPYRPSHRYRERITLTSKRKTPYDLKIQDVHSKRHYDSDYYDSPAKSKYHHHKLMKPEYASSNYFIGSNRNKHPSYHSHYNYPDNYKDYRIAVDYPDSHAAFSTAHHTTPDDFQRRPDPYYTSTAYAKDKNFGVNPLEKDFDIPPLNVSAEKFSRPDIFHYPPEKYSPSHSPERKANSFLPSYGPSGYPKEKYSPRVSYTSSFDSSDTRFKYPNHPYSHSSTEEKDPYLQSGSSAAGQTPYPIAGSGISSASQIFYNKGKPVNVSPEFGESFRVYTYGSSLENNDNFPSIENNKTSQPNISTGVRNGDTKIPYPLEGSAGLVFSSIHDGNRVTLPLCSLNENGTFCLHDVHYPYAAINNAINKNRERLENLLLKVPENETEKMNMTGNSYGSCQVRIRYGTLMRGVNTEGKWKIVAKLPQNYDSHNYSQVVRLEQCYAPGSSCNPSNPNSASKCVQEFAPRTLLSWSPKNGLHFDTFYLPSACVCHLEEKSSAQFNQSQQSHQLKQTIG